MRNENMDKAKADYVTGSESLAKLSEKYGIPIGTIKRTSNKEHWGKEREKHRSKVIRIASDRSARAQSKVLSEVVGKYDKFGKVLDDFIAQLQDNMAIILNSRQPCREMESMANTLAKMLEIKRSLYGIPTQAEAEAQAIASAQLELQKRRLENEEKKTVEDKTLHVVFDGDAEELSE